MFLSKHTKLVHIYVNTCNAQATAVSSHVQSEELPVVTTGNANNEYDNNTWVLNEWSLVDFAWQIAAGMVSNRK